MNTHLALLRGINVAGKRKILMADLRTLMTNLGHTNVTTYIQSGNVLFTTTKKQSLEKIADQITQEIETQYEFTVPVIVLKTADLKTAATQNPFPINETTINQLHLTFLKTTPSPENLKKIKTYNFPPDQFSINGNFVYLLCENKYHKTKLSNTFFEKKLAVPASTRNWKTITKILTLI